MSGPLVNGCCIWSRFGQPPEQIEEAKEKERRSRDKAAREGSPYNSILYQKYVVVGSPAQPSAPPDAVGGNDPPTAPQSGPVADQPRPSAYKSNWKALTLPALLSP
jgi:hypothetical protein